MGVTDDFLPFSSLSNSIFLLKVFARHVEDLSMFTQGDCFQHLPWQIFQSLFHVLTESVVCKLYSRQTSFTAIWFTNICRIVLEVYWHLNSSCPSSLLTFNHKSKNPAQKDYHCTLGYWYCYPYWLTCCPYLLRCRFTDEKVAEVPMCRCAEVTAECRSCQLAPVLCGTDLNRSPLLFKHVGVWGQ